MPEVQGYLLETVSKVPGKAALKQITILAGLINSARSRPSLPPSLVPQ